MKKRMIVLTSVIGAIIIVIGCFLIYPHINWTKVDPWIIKAQKLHKEGRNAYFGCFFLVFIAYLIKSLLYFRKDPEGFTDNVWKIRKTFYVLYLVMTAVGIVAGYIDFNDWKTLTQLTAFVVFVDLAVFQTPSITKIWSAEFQHRGSSIKAMEGNLQFISSTTKKLEISAEVIQQTEDYFAPKERVPTDWRSYHVEVKQYLNLYASKFRFRIELFPFKVDSDIEKTKDNLRKSFRNLETFHFLRLDDTPGKDGEKSHREKKIEKLIDGQSQLFEADNLLVIPIFKKRGFLLTVKGSDVKVDEVDITHMVNFCRIFNWYM